MKLKLHWHDYKYFPYEKRLAKREVKELLGEQPEQTNSCLSVDVSPGTSWVAISERFTYFREVADEAGEYCTPRQARLEASSNGGLPRRPDGKTHCAGLSRQQTRYGAHGLHEYRGKFNPQIVRVIGNLLQVPKGGVVVDPFCGSGTTLLEALHNDWNAAGIDINPLAIEIANAKIDAMEASPKALETGCGQLRDALGSLQRELDFDTSFSSSTLESVSQGTLDEENPRLNYLRDWFTPSTLAQVLRIELEIKELSDGRVRRLFEVVLSDILREASQQDSGDLRIRREKEAPENRPVFTLFLDALDDRVSSILKARTNLNGELSAQQVAKPGDIREAARCLPSTLAELQASPDEVSALITSPPYATALPYIDTQRLSLVFLGFLEPGGIRSKERELIGAREITTTSRRDAYASIEENEDGLPAGCIDLCRELLAAVDPETDGFRRQNKPALLYRYLRDMQQMYGSLGEVLSPSTPYALVVGRNETTLGGKTYQLDTPSLLSELAIQQGFKLTEEVELDTYQRYDVHRKNSIDTEALLLLESA